MTAKLILDVAKLREHYMRGDTINQTRAAMGCSYGPVQKAFYAFKRDLEYRPDDPTTLIEQHRPRALQLYRAGVGLRHASRQLGCSVTTARTLYLSFEEKTSAPMESLLENNVLSNAPPPSPAALRLAQFDPVVARALRARLGLPIEDNEYGK